MPYKYAYFIGILFFALVWLIFFLIRKDLRKEMLFMSMIAAPVAPIAQILWFYEDYWRPGYIINTTIAGIPIGIEELLFAFFVGGISCVSFETIFSKKTKQGKSRNKEAVIIFIITILLGIFFKYILKVNSIWATTYPMLIASMIMIIWDKDLILDFLLSGLLMGIITAFMYLLLLQIFPSIFTELWVDGVFSGLKIINIPIEEFLWFITMGSLGGIFYEFWKNVKRYTPLKKVNS